MTTMKGAVVALTAVLCAAAVTASAQAKGMYAGGGPVGVHMAGPHISGPHTSGHVVYAGHMHPAHIGHHHHHFFPGFGIYAPAYYGDDYGDCYRVYRYHRWRIVCDD